MILKHACVSHIGTCLGLALKVLGLFCVLILTTTSRSTAQGQSEPDRSNGRMAEQLARSARHAQSRQQFTLQYRMQPGEVLRWEIEHIATTNTTIKGKTESSSSRSRSVKVWTIESVDSRDNIRFTHSIDSISMWHQVGEQPPVSFDSRTDSSAPPEYRSVAETIGQPIDTITIDPTGQVISRRSGGDQVRFGTGEVTPPLPTEPVSIGSRWEIPGELTARHSDGRMRHLKTRVLYQLESVEDNLALITFRTEVLTPIDDERVRSQIVQQMTRGRLLFDLQAGRLVRREIDWNERVQGFETPDSILEYLGRFTERLLSDQPEPRSADKSSTTGESDRMLIKSPDGRPILRY